MKKHFLLFLVLIVSHFLFGQIPSGGSGGSGSRIDSGFSFVPVPYINYSRSLGFGIGFLPMGMYNVNPKDTISPSSTSGLLGMYTTNGTWFGMGFTQLYIKEDKYRVTSAFGVGNINFQFYSDNDFSPGFINYSTAAVFAYVGAQRKIHKKIYAGLNYTYLKYDTEFENDFNIPISTLSELHGIGASVTWDKRSDVYYPTDGFMTNLNYTTFLALFNDDTSNKMEFDFSKYWGFNDKRDVFAVRSYVGLAVGELNFNQQFVVGRKDIRGYSEGAFRGDQLVALQAEYRWNPFNKIGFVGFAGSAMVFNSINERDNGAFLPGIGGGMRYMIFPKNKMNVGIDIAAGKNDWSFGFQIGEAF